MDLLFHINGILKRVRGGVETIIASSRTNTRSLPQVGGAGEITASDDITIEMECARTTLKSGDILRFTVEWVTESVTGVDIEPREYEQLIQLDPENVLRTAINYNLPGGEGQLFQYSKPRQLKITIPFKMPV